MQLGCNVIVYFLCIYFYDFLLSVVGNNGGPLQVTLGNSKSHEGGTQVHENWEALI